MANASKMSAREEKKEMAALAVEIDEIKDKMKIT